MRRLLIGLGLLLLASPAEAQVNVEPLRKKIREEGFSGSVEGSVTGRLGNVQGILASGVGQMGWGSARHLFFVHARGDYTELNNRLLTARHFLHARYNLTLVDDLVAMELFAQQQADAFLLLRQRELIGTGPRFSLFQGTAYGTFLGLAWMLEYERNAVPAGATDARDTLYNRWSAYAAVQVKTDERVEFSITGYVQPRIVRPKDVRVFVETLLSVQATKRFSVRIYATVRHDSEPVTTVRPTDIEVRNALTWTF